jgi:hypothetical protein
MEVVYPEFFFRDVGTDSLVPVLIEDQDGYGPKTYLYLPYR